MPRSRWRRRGRRGPACPHAGTHRRGPSPGARPRAAPASAPTGSFSLGGILGRFSRPVPEVMGYVADEDWGDRGPRPARSATGGRRAAARRVPRGPLLRPRARDRRGDCAASLQGTPSGPLRSRRLSWREGTGAQERASFVVDQPVRADLDLPPAVHPGDHVTGRLRVSSASGRAVVRLSCHGRRRRCPGLRDAIATPAEMSFAARPGLYAASVEDAATGRATAWKCTWGSPAVPLARAGGRAPPRRGTP